MFRQGRKPTTPGEILKEEFLEPLGITQRELADHIGCDYKVINRIVNAQMATDLWNLRKPRKKIHSLLDQEVA